jgi:hypothetical protein
LSRNLGLISGASAMGTFYAAGPRIAQAAGFGVDDETGLRFTFVVATCLAGLALSATWWGQRRH